MIEHYEIGKVYQVPTVLYPWFGKVQAWPVFGPLHSDPEFLNFPHLHYHVDIRFLSAAEAAFVSRHGHYATGRGLISAFGYPLCSRGDVHPEPVLRRRKFQRHWPEYPFRGRAEVKQMQTAFAGKSLIRKNGDVICPHRGASLTTVPADDSGIVTCPLHGLRFCAKTGAAVTA